MISYPKIQAVHPLAGKRLRVTFATGTTKIYDCTPLLKELAFAPLKDEWFFRHVQADRSGFGVVWNDSVDLSESEVWINGTTEQPT